MEKPELKCHIVSWDEAYSLAKSLVRKIKSSGFKPDLVVGVARGGLVPARVVCDFLLQKDLASIKVEHWGIAKTLGNAIVKFPLPAEADIAGKKVLVVDDVADTGDTYSVIMDYFKEKNAAEIRTAVLQYKTCSSFVPDYWGEKHDEWKWIIYPWSLYEDMTGFIGKVLTQPMTEEAIRRGLKNSFDIRISIEGLREILKDMRLEGNLKRKKIGGKFFLELVETRE